VDERAPHLELTVTLPSETGSVPVVRRLAGQTLRALGVTDDDIEDVQLAITEACANVVKHAADTDTYEVKVNLGTERCAITVIDRGSGFDATLLTGEAHHEAEAGRGVRLMRALVDSLDFEFQPLDGSVVHMVKALHYDESNPLHSHRTPDARGA
jgi:serine/threonine-protein kinase RsbW